MLSAIVLAPSERIKCLVQAQPFEPIQGLNKEMAPFQKKYTGTIDCLRKVYKEGGIRSVYKGTLLTFMRDIPSTGFYFVAYEFLKKELNLESTKYLDFFVKFILYGY